MKCTICNGTGRHIMFPSSTEFGWEDVQEEIYIRCSVCKGRGKVKTIKHFYSPQFTCISSECGLCNKPEKNERYHYLNGGIACDMNNGPCACGAWHKPEDFK